jgi:hypothetical protein
VKPRVFRSKGAWIVGWIWLVFAAFNAVDLIVRGSGAASLIAAAVLAVLTAVIYVTCLRPGIFVREDGVLVRNPLRDAFIPWAALGDVRVTHAILVESGDETIRAWTPQVSTRELSRSRRRADAAEALAGRTHAHWVAEQIVEERVRARSRGGDSAASPSLTWSSVSLAALGASLLFVVAAAVAAL